MIPKESRKKFVLRGLQALCTAIGLVSAFVAGVLFSRDPEIAKFEIVPVRPKAVVHISEAGVTTDMSQDFALYSEAGVNQEDEKVVVTDLKKPLSIFNEALEVELIFDEVPIQRITSTKEPESSQASFTRKIVASASGTKYYFEDCKDIARIKAENIVTFSSENEAKAAGYEPSKCVQDEQ